MIARVIQGVQMVMYVLLGHVDHATDVHIVHKLVESIQ